MPVLAVLESTFNLPSNPCAFFFWTKARETPQKARVFLFAEPLKSLEKKGKTHKKAREIGKRKKQGLEGRGAPCPPYHWSKNHYTHNF